VAVTFTMQELRSARDVDLGASEWVEVTQEMIDRFAEATGDHQWIHVDRERAAQGPFGTTIAHGYLTLSLLPVLLGDLLVTSDATMGVNYGLDKLRLTSPVEVGSRVRGRATLTSTEDKAGGLLVRLDVTVEIEDEDRPALVAEVLLLRYGG
jgi:acyl dehydratase